MGALNRHINILEYTLASLMRRKFKHAGLVLLYSGVVGALASVMFFSSAIRREAALVLQGSPEMVVQRIVAGRHDLIDAAALERLRNYRGVTSARARLWGYYYDPAVGANYTLMVPPEFKHAQGSVAIGAGISRARQAAAGDLFPFVSTATGLQRPLRVAEVLSSETELMSSDLVLMAEEDFRGLTGMPEGKYTDIALSVRNPRELVTLARKIAEDMPGTRPIIRDETLRTYEAVFNWRSGMVSVLLMASVLAFVIFAWDRASGLSAEERRELGILKALGWETSDVLLMKGLEGGCISLLSFLLGILAAYAHVYFTDAALLAPALKGWSTLYPAYGLMPSVDYYQIATLFFLTIAPYTIATMAPSWRAATADPEAVMRQ